MKAICKYRLFIDDERDPPEDGKPWVVARSYDYAVQVVSMMGAPRYISFDHDLGDNSKTGYDFAKWLVQQDIDTDFLEPDFIFDVHSQNPVGRDNIVFFLVQYLRMKAFGDIATRQPSTYQEALELLREHKGFAESLTEEQLKEIQDYEGPETVGRKD